MATMRKCTTARSNAKSGGFEEPPTKNRETNSASTGKNTRYTSRHQVAARGDSSAGRPCHQRYPLCSAASGAINEVIKSNFPVLASVRIEVRTRRESDTRKYCSAGNAGAA